MGIKGSLMFVVVLTALAVLIHGYASSRLMPAGAAENLAPVEPL
ncbi:MAG TPA: hypothetical protein VJB97_04120 [Candidatus Paceibacterota bacterium]